MTTLQAVKEVLARQDYKGAMQAVAAIEARALAAEADNAALVQWVSANGHHIGDMLCPHTGGYACEPRCVAYGIASRSHPGAALLEEVRTLREQVAALTKERDDAQSQAASAERDFRTLEQETSERIATLARDLAMEEALRDHHAALVVSARDEGLEEAALSFSANDRAEEIRRIIRALKSGSGIRQRGGKGPWNAALDAADGVLLREMGRYALREEVGAGGAIAEARERIRALKSSPGERFIPESEVREALHKHRFRGGGTPAQAVNECLISIARDLHIAEDGPLEVGVSASHEKVTP